MRDLMIDIETLGNRPGSVILSIGAVAFDAETGEIGEEFYAAIDPSSASAAGLTTDISTMIWWMKQSPEARDAAFSGDRLIDLALGDFGDFARRVDPTRVWAKPPSFDLVLLEAALKACSVPVPWHFRTHRDCRTIFDLTGTLQPNVGTAHNALDDAKSQAFGVIAAYAKLRQAQPPEPIVEGKAEAFDRFVAARKKHVDAVAAYNARRELATAERMRGSWAIKLDDEYRAMHDAQSELFATIQAVCDAAIATAAEGKRFLATEDGEFNGNALEDGL